MQKNKTKIILFFIILLGFFIRIYKLNELPFGFHQDELDAGYIGRYILLHGKDISGNSWPIFVDKFGDFRPAGIFYLSGLSTFIFGINEFAVRFPVALFGTMTIIAIYLLCFEIFGNKKIAIFSAFLLAILPWHISLSRATSEAVVSLFFFVFGISLLLRGSRTQSVKYLGLATITLIVGYFFYHSFRLLTPLAILPLPFLFKNNIQIRKILIMIFLFFLIISFGIGMTPWGKGRFNQVAFFRNPILTNIQESLIQGEGPNKIITARIFHNKAVIYGREFIGKYLDYFSPNFLFQNGGLPFWYTVPDTGLFFYFTIPIILFALLFLKSDQRSQSTIWYLLILLLIAPIPGALTFDDHPNLNRAIFLIIPLTILISFGFYQLLLLLKDKDKIFKILIFCFVIISTSEFVYFWHQYTIHSQSYKSYFRRQGNKEMILAVSKIQNNYQNIVIPSYDNLILYYLFYLQKFEKREFQESLIDDFAFKIDNLIFIRNWCPTNSETVKAIITKSENKSLIINNGDCKTEENKSLKPIETIQRKDATNAYKIFEVKKNQ